MSESVSQIVSTLKTVAGIGAAIVIVFAVLLNAPGLVGAEASYVVLSDSMSPTIEAGDVVVVRETPSNAISVGDIITFQDTAGILTTEGTDRITHRVVEVVDTEDGTRFRTQGDAAEEPDPALVASSAIIGTVWFHIPVVGHLIVFASSRLGLLTLVVLPGVLLVVTELYSLYTDALVEVEDTDTSEADATGGSADVIPRERESDSADSSRTAGVTRTAVSERHRPVLPGIRNVCGRNGDAHVSTNPLAGDGNGPARVSDGGMNTDDKQTGSATDDIASWEWVDDAAVDNGEQL